MVNYDESQKQCRLFLLQTTTSKLALSSSLFCYLLTNSAVKKWLSGNIEEELSLSVEGKGQVSFKLVAKSAFYNKI